MKKLLISLLALGSISTFAYGSDIETIELDSCEVEIVPSYEKEIPSQMIELIISRGYVPVYNEYRKLKLDHVSGLDKSVRVGWPLYYEFYLLTVEENASRDKVLLVRSTTHNSALGDVAGLAEVGVRKRAERRNLRKMAKVLPYCIEK
jgi:hypothetical protein